MERARMAAMLWSGGLCGLAGAVELSGVLGTLYENYAPGYGFTAVAVALLGRLNPYGIIASALFFGALYGGVGQHGADCRHFGQSFLRPASRITLLVLLGFQWLRWRAARTRRPVTGGRNGSRCHTHCWNRTAIDQAPGHYLRSIGAIFAEFGTQTQDSGNVSYGVQIGNERYFVKTAGPVDNSAFSSQPPGPRGVCCGTQCA